MPIWTFVELGLQPIFEASDISPESVFGTKFSSLVGDNTAFIIGGGSNNNIYGGRAAMIFDWEEFLTKGLSNTVGKIGFVGKTLAGAAGLVMSMLTTQVGGDVKILYGNNSTFNYQGEDFTVKRMREDFNLQILNQEDYEGFPAPIAILYYLGVFGMLTTTLTMQFMYGTGQGSSSEEAVTMTETLSNSMVNFEMIWISLLKEMEVGANFLSISATEIEQLEQEIKTHELAIADLEAEIASLEEASTAAADPAIKQTINEQVNAKKIDLQAEMDAMEDAEVRLTEKVKARVSSWSRFFNLQETEEATKEAEDAFKAGEKSGENAAKSADKAANDADKAA
ncbi:MAG: hypothetical protein ACKO26_07055, partial [Planctomycetota bacterium]